MKVHEKLGIEVDEKLCVQYLQNTEIARDFATYYELYLRYNELYKIPDILEGRFPEDKKSIRNGSFDEKLSIIGLLTDALMEEFRNYSGQQAVQKLLFETIKSAAASDSHGDTGAASLEEALESLKATHQQKKEAGLLDRDEEKSQLTAIKALEECIQKICKTSCGLDGAGTAGNGALDAAKAWFTERENARQSAIVRTGEHLLSSFEFMEQTFGDPESLTGSQEMVIFITELSNAYHSLKFVRETGNEAYYKYNKLLLLSDRKQELTEMARKLVF